MTKEIAEALNEAVTRKASAWWSSQTPVYGDAGVQKPGGQLITSCMLGTFRKDPRTPREFLELIRRPCWMWPAGEPRPGRRRRKNPPSAATALAMRTVRERF